MNDLPTIWASPCPRVSQVDGINTKHLYEFQFLYVREKKQQDGNYFIITTLKYALILTYIYGRQIKAGGCYKLVVQNVQRSETQ
jgi:hypothetical protein